MQDLLFNLGGDRSLGLLRGDTTPKRTTKRRKSSTNGPPNKRRKVDNEKRTPQPTTSAAEVESLQEKIASDQLNCIIRYKVTLFVSHSNF